MRMPDLSKALMTKIALGIAMPKKGALDSCQFRPYLLKVNLPAAERDPVETLCTTPAMADRHYPKMLSSNIRGHQVSQLLISLRQGTHHFLAMDGALLPCPRNNASKTLLIQVDSGEVRGHRLMGLLRNRPCQVQISATLTSRSQTHHLQQKVQVPTPALRKCHHQGRVMATTIPVRCL